MKIMDEIKNYKWASEHMIVKAIPKGNDNIGIRIGDIELVPYVMEQNNGQIAGAVVTERLVEYWGSNIPEVYDVAWNNTHQRIRKLSEVLMEMCGMETPDTEPVSYVVDTQNGVFGASAIFKKGVAESICDILGDDKIVISPTSVHEVIVHPGTDLDVQAVRGALESTLGVATEPKDFLSRNIYEYDRRTGSFRIV